MPIQQSVQKIPFHVSARTARLIGRENITNNQGAIIELVKNSYDADSQFTIVYFDNFYGLIRNEIEEEYYEQLVKKNILPDLLDANYTKLSNGKYILKDQKNNKENYKLLQESLLRLSTLYIIDNGEGMTDEIIKTHWMTIGTDNKQVNFTTKGGRVKAGAKGIGRFALDKLGKKCEMTTIYKPQSPNIANKNFHGYKWIVHWEEFEGKNKTINDISADLYSINNIELYTLIKDILPENFLSIIPKDILLKHGTILKITGLHDYYDDSQIEILFDDLETLIPPKDIDDFSIYVFSSFSQQKYGKVSDAFCDEYDYKLVAKSDSKQNVSIEIHRNEQDLRLIPVDFFSRPNMQQKGYTLKDFESGARRYTKTFSELLPGFQEIDQNNTFDEIGPFEFTLFFLKKTYGNDDAKRFFYKQAPLAERKLWLEKFGGIKLFRDNFRVRPYGEPKSVAFDWLSLGARKASSPAGVAKKEGGYRVDPDNIAGTIKISRLTNINFEDKSSREGLQESTALSLFKRILISIVREFEDDRAYIARELSAFDEERFFDVRQEQEAQNLVNQILLSHRDEQINIAELSPHKKELLVVAHLNKQQAEKIERLQEEQKLIRALASCGIVLASFSHDLSKLSESLIWPLDEIKRLISYKVNESEYAGIEDRLNPFRHIDKIKSQNQKLNHWLNFSLGVTRKDKRTRKNISLKAYFTNFKSDWTPFLDERGVVLNISSIQDISFRAFEIDLDSIFSNLLVNSIDAFINSKLLSEREVEIEAFEKNNQITINYSDNGPGLSKDIDKPEKIFEALFTTRRKPHTGEEIGTGLGMWLVKLITEENKGTVELLHPQEGFSIRLIFPVKYRAKKDGNDIIH